MIPQLGQEPTAPFPDAEQALASPDGLLAWGGDLDPERLINAYHRGIFPWYSDEQPLLWWSPSQRCVIYPGELHVSRRLSRVIRQGALSISADRAFERVVEGCAMPRKFQETTWITPEMAQAYTRLHTMGFAHSIEVWAYDRLVGGLYGLAFGRMFFGESMFSLISDASKIAMVALCRQLHAWGYALLDCQVTNPHLESMGAVLLDRGAFLDILREHIDRPGDAGKWTDSFMFDDQA